MIPDFVYHDDCKEFYIKHIDDLEDYVIDIEEQIGEPVRNTYKLPRYTFVVWLCFEELCRELYVSIFESGDESENIDNEN